MDTGVGESAVNVPRTLAILAVVSLVFAIPKVAGAGPLGPVQWNEGPAGSPGSGVGTGNPNGTPSGIPVVEAGAVAEKLSEPMMSAGVGASEMRDRDPSLTSAASTGSGEFAATARLAARHAPAAPDARPILAPAAGQVPPLPSDNAPYCGQGSTVNAALAKAQGKRNWQVHFLVEEMKCKPESVRGAEPHEREIAPAVPLSLENPQENRLRAENRADGGPSAAPLAAVAGSPTGVRPTSALAQGAGAFAAAPPAEAYAFWVLVALVLLPVLRLYTRLRRSDLLATPMRQSVHELVVWNPGITAGAVSRELRVDRRTSLHHLRVLQGFGLVASERIGGRLRYYENGGSDSEAERRVALALRNRNSRTLLPLLLRKPDVRLAELARATGLAKTTILGQLQRLRSLGILEEGRVRGDMVDPLLKALDARGRTSQHPRAQPV